MPEFFIRDESKRRAKRLAQIFGSLISERDVEARSPEFAARLGQVTSDESEVIPLEDVSADVVQMAGDYATARRFDGEIPCVELPQIGFVPILSTIGTLFDPPRYSSGRDPWMSWVREISRQRWPVTGKISFLEPGVLSKDSLARCLVSSSIGLKDSHFGGLVTKTGDSRPGCRRQPGDSAWVKTLRTVVCLLRFAVKTPGFALSPRRRMELLGASLVFRRRPLREYSQLASGYLELTAAYLAIKSWRTRSRH